MSRFLILLNSALTIGALCICTSPASAWQADPFGGGPIAPRQSGASDSAAENNKDGRRGLDFFAPDVRLVVDSVRRSNPKTPKQLGEALRTMMDMEQYEEARFYLDQLNKAALDDSALYQLNESIGSDFFFRLARSNEMAPEGPAFAERLLAASSAAANSPVRIDELIEKLQDENVAIRSDASRALARLGDAGVARMLEVFADSSRSDQFAAVRASLLKMGSVGISPLIAASRADNEQVQFEAVLALSSVRAPEAFDAIVARYYSSQTPQRVKKIAAKAFTDQYGYFPEPSKASNAWWIRTNELLTDDVISGSRRLGFDEPPASVWRWDSGQQKLGEFPLTQTAARRVRAADTAEVLAEINPDNQELQQLSILAQLEAQKLLVGPARRINTLAIREKSKANAQTFSVVLEKALEKELIPAAIAACEVLEDIADPGVLTSGTHRPAALIQAILFGDRHLQYAAVRAIAAIDPQHNFSGSSYFAQAAIYMASYAERPGVLVGNSRQDLARTLAARMLVSGLSGSTAQNGRDFYHQATRDANLRYLLVCDTFHRPDYAELVQQLRQDWRTKRLPIAILYREENTKRVNRVADLDPLTVALPFTMNPEFVAQQVQQLERFSTDWPVTIDDRRLHSEFALNWLAKAAKGGEKYNYLDLASHEGQLSQLIFTRGAEQVAAKVIAALGTPRSQRVLVNYASEAALPLENRQAAADAFKSSVQANGVLLTSSEIMQQYDRYNASESEPQASQRVLGLILDVIESKKDTR